MDTEFPSKRAVYYRSMAEAILFLDTTVRNELLLRQMLPQIKEDPFCTLLLSQFNTQEISDVLSYFLPIAQELIPKTRPLLRLIGYSPAEVEEAVDMLKDKLVENGNVPSALVSALEAGMEQEGDGGAQGAAAQAPHPGGGRRVLQGVLRRGHRRHQRHLRPRPGDGAPDRIHPGPAQPVPPGRGHRQPGGGLGAAGGELLGPAGEEAAGPGGHAPGGVQAHPGQHGTRLRPPAGEDPAGGQRGRQPRRHPRHHPQRLPLPGRPAECWRASRVTCGCSGRTAWWP